MTKAFAAGMTALLLMASPVALTQPSFAQDRLNSTELGALTDARIAIIKSTLQLTPDQEKLWPPIEAAIRGRAKDREARLANVERTVGERRDNPIEAIQNRDPIDFMNRRASALEQRAADVKKLAMAWQPLYQTLTPDQKKRMGYLGVVVLRDLRNRVEQRHLASADDED